MMGEAGERNVPSSDTTMSTKLTTLNVEQKHLEAIDAAQTELFGTDAVARRAVVERLLTDHPDVEYGQ